VAAILGRSFLALPSRMRRGRGVNSPLQFEQIQPLSSAQSTQKVASKLHMNTSAPQSNFLPHFSQAHFISNAMPSHPTDLKPRSSKALRGTNALPFRRATKYLCGHWQINVVLEIKKGPI
jgi:hypothetical protein